MMNKITSRLIDGLSREVFLWLRCKVAHFEALRARANQFFKLDGLVEMVTRRVSEEREAIIARPRLRFGLPSCPRRSSADEPFY